MTENCVLGRAIKRLNFKMLFDPFEKQLNLPTFPVKFGDRQGIKYSIVGYESVNDVGRKVFIDYHSETFRIMFSRLVSGESDHLITDYSSLQVSRTGSFNFILHIVLCPGNKESSLFVNDIEQTKEIQVTLIYYVNSGRLNIQFVEDLDIMDRSLSQMHENRKVTSEIQLGMHLDTSFVFPEGSPWAQLQTQTYCTAVKSIDKIINVNPEIIIALVHRTGNINKYTSKISIYPPVAKFIGFCKSISRNCMSYSTVVEFARDRFQTVLNIPETIPLGKLGKAHNIEVVATCEIANSMVPIIPVNTFIELVFWYCRHKLCENCFSFIHGDNRYDLAIKVNFKSLKFITLVTYLLLTYYIAFSLFKRDASDKISLFIQNYNIETLTPDKDINPMSQFLITILAEIARMERKSIESRLPVATRIITKMGA